jgi:hypothetical protein
VEKEVGGGLVDMRFNLGMPLRTVHQRIELPTFILSGAEGGSKSPYHSLLVLSIASPLYQPVEQFSLLHSKTALSHLFILILVLLLVLPLVFLLCLLFLVFLIRQTRVFELQLVVIRERPEPRLP